MSWVDVGVFIVGFAMGAGLMAWRERSEIAPPTSNLKPQTSNMSDLGALAVPDTAPIWLAFNLILDIAERETIENARKMSFEPNKCMAAVNAGDGINLVRIKLNEARATALRGGTGERVSG